MNILGFSTAFYGWTERYWRENNKEASWEELFRNCAEAGLDAVEIDAEPKLVSLAKSYGLSISSSYVGLPLHEKSINIEETVLPVARRLAEAGGRDLLINADPKGGWGVALPKTEDEFKVQGDHLAKIASAVSGLGVKVSMHNHADEKHNAEGDLRSVIDYSSPDVGLCIDTGWAYVAGFDPIEWIKKYPNRVYSFHLRNQNENTSTEDIIDGNIDMRGMLHELKKINYEGYLTFELVHYEETQAKRTMVEDTRLSVDFLKKVLENNQ
jgi:inosose dehydratase